MKVNKVNIAALVIAFLFVIIFTNMSSAQSGKANITDEQRKEARALLDAAKITFLDIKGQIFVKQNELKALHNSSFPSVQAIGEKANEIALLRKKMHEEGVKLGLNIDKALGLEPGTHDFGLDVFPWQGKMGRAMPHPKKHKGFHEGRHGSRKDCGMKSMNHNAQDKHGQKCKCPKCSEMQKGQKCKGQDCKCSKDKGCKCPDCKCSEGQECKCPGCKCPKCNMKKMNHNADDKNIEEQNTDKPNDPNDLNEVQG